MITERYQSFKSKIYKKYFEADEESILSPEDIGLLDNKTSAPNGVEDQNQNVQPIVDDNMEAVEQTEEEKEEEDRIEQELHGKVSSIMSDIADTLGPETMRFYSEVEAKTIEYFKNRDDMLLEEKRKLLMDDMPAVGLKIIQTGKKQNFVDRDNIVYIGILEGCVDIANKLGEDDSTISSNDEDTDEIEETKEEKD